jgi:carboxylesterase type B
LIQESPWGAYTFSPTIDGNFVPEFPGQLLAKGGFDQSLKVMVGHNADEGLFFTPPDATNDGSIYNYIDSSFENMPDVQKDYVLDVLYPPVFDGSQGYTDNVGRTSKLVSEYVFTCNAYYLGTAFLNQTYSYKFSIPPALHGQDIYYTYFTGNNGTPNAIPAQHNPLNLTTFANVTNVTVALTLQEFITSFTQTGKPYGRIEQGIPEFPMWGNFEQKNMMLLEENNITVVSDDTVNQRCQWWMQGLFL